MEQTNSSNAIHDVLAGGGKPELAGNPIVGGAATAAAAAAATVPPSPPSRSASILKDGTRVNSVSPVSAGAGGFSPPQLTAELQGQGPPHPLNSTELHSQTPAYPPMPNTAELHAPYGVPRNPSQPLGQPPSSVSPMLSNASELQGSGGMCPGPNRQELQGQGTPPQFMSNRHEMMGPQLPAELQPTAWQSGPVPGYHEMDGHGRGRGGQP